MEAVLAFAEREFLKEFKTENVPLISVVSKASASISLLMEMDPLSSTSIPIDSKLYL